jgi:hypothetical protein
MSIEWSVLIRDPLGKADHTRVGALLQALAQHVWPPSGYGYADAGACSWTVAQIGHPVYGLSSDTDIESYQVEVAVLDEAGALGCLLDGYPEEARAHLRSMGCLDDREQYLERLGYCPAQRLFCEALGYDRVPAALACHITLHLAELLDGWVDFSGWLPPLRPDLVDFEPPGSKRHGDAYREPPGTPLRLAGQGQIVELYTTHDNREVPELVNGEIRPRFARWYRSLVDAAYFRHWLEHGGLDSWRWANP